MRERSTVLDNFLYDEASRPAFGPTQATAMFLLLFPYHGYPVYDVPFVTIVT